MSALARLSTAKARRSAARDALAAAINSITGLHRVVKQAEIVAGRARSLRDQAAERLQAASAAASRGREQHTKAMLASARSGDAVAVGATRELRIAADDARDDLDAAEAALEAAETERDEAIANRDRVGREIVVARDAVLAEAAAVYVADVRMAMDDLFRKAAALKFLGPLPGLPHDVGVAARVIAANVLLMQQNSTGGYVEFSVTEWEAAAKALLSDPDAPLPEIGGR